MNTRTAWIVLIVIILAGVAWYVFSPKPAAAPSEGMAVVPEAAVPTDEMNVITLTDAGFSPTHLTIKVGETVRFVNQSSRGMWIGSDDHPTHTHYDGTSTKEHCADGKATNGTFDECSAAPTGSSWEYTFEKAGTFGFHNHLGASAKGTVVVE